MSGFARLDLRMRQDGKVFLLEANANPDLTRGEDLAESAEAAGINYDKLISRIVNLGHVVHAGVADVRMR
jgi:D-alanine-D-alanine ligase